jgi:hypothetical protein
MFLQSPCSFHQRSIYLSRFFAQKYRVMIRDLSNFNYELIALRILVPYSAGFLPWTETSLTTIYCLNCCYGDICFRINTSHLRRFMFPISLVILQYTKSIDPQILNSKAIRNGRCILKQARKLIPLNPFNPLFPIFSRSYDGYVVAPAMA